MHRVSCSVTVVLNLLISSLILWFVNEVQWDDEASVRGLESHT